MENKSKKLLLVPLAIGALGVALFSFGVVNLTSYATYEAQSANVIASQQETKEETTTAVVEIDPSLDNEHTFDIRIAAQKALEEYSKQKNQSDVSNIE